MFENGGCGFSMPVAPIANYGGNGGFGGNWGNDWIALAIIAMIFGYGNFGFGGGMGGFGGMGMFLPFMMGGGMGFPGAVSAAATQADIQRGFDTSAIIGKLDGISNGICDSTFALSQAISQNGIANMQGFNVIGRDIMQLGFTNQQCCCETNRNIDAVRYENARNTCDIVNAIREDGAMTRAQITQNEIQNLRDQLNTANMQLSQQAQSANLINELRPCARPAYLTCSPYVSYGYPYGYGRGNDCSGCNQCQYC